MSAPLYNQCQNAECYACDMERIGCPCDGAYDDGCWICTDDKWSRPPCGPWTEETASGVRKEAGK